jgi:hypothetical protein
MSADIHPRVSPRVRLVNGIIGQAEMYHIILIRGTPACRKTTIMKLVANELLARYSENIPLYIITGWNKEKVTRGRGLESLPITDDRDQRSFLVHF